METKLDSNQDGNTKSERRDQNRNEEIKYCQEPGRTEKRTGQENLQATDFMQSQKKHKS
jgi:hypothetical protein